VTRETDLNFKSPDVVDCLQGNVQCFGVACNRVAKSFVCFDLMLRFKRLTIELLKITSSGELRNSVRMRGTSRVMGSKI
jgi:hypothetical protein